MKLKMMILFALLLNGALVRAQAPNPGDPQFTAQNNVLILRFYPKDKTGKIFLVGKKAADINFNQDAKLLSVTLLDKGQSEELKLSKAQDGYLVETNKDFPSEYQLMMKAEVRGRQHQLKVRVNNTKP